MGLKLRFARLKHFKGLVLEQNSFRSFYCTEPATLCLNANKCLSRLVGKYKIEIHTYVCLVLSSFSCFRLLSVPLLFTCPPSWVLNPCSPSVSVKSSSHLIQNPSPSPCLVFSSRILVLVDFTSFHS